MKETVRKKGDEEEKARDSEIEKEMMRRRRQETVRKKGDEEEKARDSEIEKEMMRRRR